ncbi:MAG: hypothetical protein HUU41_05380 [Bryobacteraceae bacterium]|nr:hypothetical protein [Bryobacterales bacterium]MEB2360117.1 hypothetical protein [Bryobacterales bacterium]NUN00524.1 hypothetical protein [Bryobacteraceae bacterium]
MRPGSLCPRERVLLALTHRETDRVPVDFLATAETWTNVKTFLGTADEERVLQLLGVDLRHPRQPYIGPPLETYSDGTWRDAWGVTRRKVANRFGVYDEIARHPLACINDASELDQYGWPQPDWWDAEGLAHEIRRLDGIAEYAIALEEFGDPGGMFEIAWYLRGMEQFLADLIENPDLAWELMRRVTDFYIAMLERVMRAAGERIDLIWTSDDIAHQHGILMSPRMWSNLVAPHHERLNRLVHELGARVMYHSCGAVRPFIPALIDIGTDVLDVLQFSAEGMDPREIKSTFGDRLCFHGGMDVQATLPRCSPGEVHRTAREHIAVLGAGGGYILSPTHNIQADTPPANILAMYDAAGSLPPELAAKKSAPESPARL